MAINLPNLMKDIIYRFKPQKTPNIIHTRKPHPDTSQPHYTKEKIKRHSLKQPEKTTCYIWGNNYQKDWWQPIKDNEGQKAVKQHPKSAERKKNTTSSGTKTLPEWQQSRSVL